MLLINRDRAKSGSERKVVSWLDTWSGNYKIPGVAIVSHYLKGRSDDESSQEADLVIITPHTTVVGEVKGTAPDATAGVLTCTAEMPWTLSGFTGDPVHVRKNDTTPYDQARDALFKLKAAVDKVGSSAFVVGLVLVVPPANATLRLEERSAPRGCAALLCDSPNPLRAWFHGAHQRQIVWTAEQAHALLTVLGVGDYYTVAQLEDEGFPRRVTPATPPAVSTPPPSRTITAPTPPQPIPTPPPPQLRTDPVPALDDTIPRPQPAVPVHPAVGERRSSRYQTAAAVALIVAIGGGVWLLARTGNGDSDPQQISNERQISSVVEEPSKTPPSLPVTEVPLPPPPPAPAPEPQGCFPFQTGC